MTGVATLRLKKDVKSIFGFSMGKDYSQLSLVNKNQI